MTIAEIIKKRGITEVMHYTTHTGLTGVLATQALKSKNLLKADQYLAHILKINTQRELDPEWNGHVHLSITGINTWLFGCSSGSWHRDANWRILSFDPEIMTHDGVHFVTTNNAYYQHLKRDKGAKALEALFAKDVSSRYGKVLVRLPTTAENLPTDQQAEVLYPEGVSTKYLRRIYVQTDDDQNEVAGQFRATRHPTIEIVVNPKKFVG